MKGARLSVQPAALAEGRSDSGACNSPLLLLIEKLLLTAPNDQKKTARRQFL